jgi:hypothetical protein
MNESNFENLITKAGETPGLSGAERAQMHAALRVHIARNPLRSMPSPYQRLFVALRRPAFALVALVLMLGAAGGGVAYAAEGSLPGDALYSVKVALVEPVQTALIFSPSAKAGWQMTLAERRINEAATLANQGRLSTSTEASLAAAFSKDVIAAGAASSSPIFAARLSAYQEVLADIEAKQGSSQTGVLQSAIGMQIALDARNAHSAASARSFKAAATRPTSAPATLSAPAEDTTEASSTATISAGQQTSEEVLSAQARLEVLEHSAAAFNINPFATTSASSTTSAPVIKHENEEQNEDAPHLHLGW